MQKNAAALITGIIILGMSTGLSLFADTDITIPSASSVATTTLQDAAVTITLSGASNDGGSVTFATTTSPAHGTLGTISGTDVLYTPESGYTGSDSFQFVATEGATSSAPATATIVIDAPVPVVPTGTIHIAVRDGATVATSTTLVIPLAGTRSIATTAGDPHEVPADSALAALVALDASSTEFDITDLQYNSGFTSFYLRCIVVPAATSTPDCDNWQYTVNSTGPALGLDKYDLHDGDTIYVYFGYPRIVELSATSTTAGAPITATAKQYDPAAGSYVPVMLPYTIGATQPDPANPWSPIEVATSTVDGSGKAIFTLTATGTYDVGIQEDYYFPTTPLVVTDATSTGSSSGSGSGTFSGGSDPYARTSFSVPDALAYLASKQNADGSCGSDFTTDWAAFAFANYPSAARDKLKAYLLSHVPSFSNVLDYERHAMALQALGISPYDGTAKNVIAPIVAAFDGTQIGSASLINDDIFSLYPLLNAGYGVDDPMLKKIATFIISKQGSDGSFAGNPDITAAAMLALGDFFALGGLNPATLGASLGMAQGYLVSHQQADGGWGTVDSTSWVQTMVNGVNLDDPAHAQSWKNGSGKTPLDYLASQQQQDGGVASTGDRTWSTEYAIVAESGQSWMSLMHYFAKPSSSGTFSGGTDPYATDATSTASSTPSASATSTEPAATSTEPIATSTQAVATLPAIELHAASSATAVPSVTHAVAKPKNPTPTASRLPPTPAAPQSPSMAPAQAAAAADAHPSLLGRIIGWFRHLFGW